MLKFEKAAQARREIDRKMAEVDLRAIRARPRNGWIRAIRTGLGMSQAALGARLSVSQGAVKKLETSEVDHTISLGKLAKVADALDCTLVYALVPRTSLEDTVQTQARKVAVETLTYVSATMDLEDQAVDEGRRSDQLEAETRRVIEGNRMWRSA